MRCWGHICFHRWFSRRSLCARRPDSKSSSSLRPHRARQESNLPTSSKRFDGNADRCMLSPSHDLAKIECPNHQVPTGNWCARFTSFGATSISWRSSTVICIILHSFLRTAIRSILVHLWLRRVIAVKIMILTTCSPAAAEPSFHSRASFFCPNSFASTPCLAPT